MTFKTIAATLTLSATLCLPTFAQQCNEQAVKDAQKQTEKEHKASKSQAKADKAAHKALKSDKVEDAAKKQDKADRDAAKAAAPNN